MTLLPISVLAQVDESADGPRAKAVPSQARRSPKERRPRQIRPAIPKNDQHAPEINLLNTGIRDGLVSVEAAGRDDGRMTMSITNNTRRQLRVVLPPGIIAQGATGQFGGMGGMGGGMGGGGMGGGMGRGGIGRRYGRRHGRRHGWRPGRHGWYEVVWAEGSQDDAPH